MKRPNYFRKVVSTVARIVFAACALAGLIAAPPNFSYDMKKSLFAELKPNNVLQISGSMPASPTLTVTDGLGPLPFNVVEIRHGNAVNAQGGAAYGFRLRAAYKVPAARTLRLSIEMPEDYYFFIAPFNSTAKNIQRAEFTQSATKIPESSLCDGDIGPINISLPVEGDYAIGFDSLLVPAFGRGLSLQFAPLVDFEALDLGEYRFTSARPTEYKEFSYIEYPNFPEGADATLAFDFTPSGKGTKPGTPAIYFEVLGKMDLLQALRPVPASSSHRLQMDQKPKALLLLSSSYSNLGEQNFASLLLTIKPAKEEYSDKAMDSRSLGQFILGLRSIRVKDAFKSDRLGMNWYEVVGSVPKVDVKADHCHLTFVQYAALPQGSKDISTKPNPVFPTTIARKLQGETKLLSQTTSKVSDGIPIVTLIRAVPDIMGYKGAFGFEIGDSRNVADYVFSN